MKDISYLQAFSPKVLKGARRILRKGLTAEDIDRHLRSFPPLTTMGRKLPIIERKRIFGNTQWGSRTLED